jgi:hypothetical protein
MNRPHAWVAAIAAVVSLTGPSAMGRVRVPSPASRPSPLRAPKRPMRLADAEFWRLIAAMSEPNGTFRSDNLLSNESRFQFVIPELVNTTTRGGAYLGVGPEQNFTYIAALKPSMAFIVDVRRGNLQLHLMYKALFELSSDRADFVSRLFSRRRPDDLSSSATIADMFRAFNDAEPNGALYERNLKAVESALVSTHGFDLTDDDLRGIEYIYHAFFVFGPVIHYSSTDGAGPGHRPTYTDLMAATDSAGIAHGYLASDEAFTFVKDLESRNLVVPIVGDFAGAKALREVGAYLRTKGVTVEAFYVSNVEQYLRLERVWGAFCGNVARLPLDETSTFIRAGHGGRYPRGTALTAEISPIGAEVEGCERRP